MPHPKHPNEPVQTDDGKTIDEEEFVGNIEEKMENDPDGSAAKLDKEGVDIEELEQ